MSGIAVTKDAVNLFYLMRLKATVRSAALCWWPPRVALRQ